MNHQLLAHERMMERARKEGRLRSHCYMSEAQTERTVTQRNALKIGARYFSSVTEARNALGISTDTITKLVKSGCGAWV